MRLPDFLVLTGSKNVNLRTAYDVVLESRINLCELGF
jgi:hypothetical protein